MSLISELAHRLARAERVTVLTGAGVSAASGVPTFRGTGGLWKRFRVEELATPEAFESDPRVVWEWYEMRRQAIARASPNAAHDVIARWSRRFPKFALVTQNVDGALVMPAAGLIDEARRRGAWTAEVNLEATPASGRVDAAIAGKAEEILPEVDALAFD